MTRSGVMPDFASAEPARMARHNTTVNTKEYPVNSIQVASSPNRHLLLDLLTASRKVACFLPISTGGLLKHIPECDRFKQVSMTEIFKQIRELVLAGQFDSLGSIDWCSARQLVGAVAVGFIRRARTNLRQINAMLAAGESESLAVKKTMSERFVENIECISIILECTNQLAINADGQIKRKDGIPVKLNGIPITPCAFTSHLDNKGDGFIDHLVRLNTALGGMPQVERLIREINQVIRLAGK